MSAPSTILVVDDATEILALLTKTLADAGYAPRPADSGELALASIAANPPDLVLLDIRMPDIDGLEVCRRLKGDPKTSAIPVILLSGFASTSDWTAGLQSGAADYILKPFRPEELLHRVRTQLALAEERQRRDRLQSSNTDLSESLRLIERERAALRDDLGKAAQMRQVMLSVLEDQRQAEAALRESEAFRKRLFESSSVPIVVMDSATCRFLDCNPAAVKIYGLATHTDVVGKTPDDVSAPVQYDGTPSPAKARHYIEHALAQATVYFEWRHRRPDGSLWDAEVHLMSFESDGRKLLQFTLQDITERKRAAEALRRSDARVQLATNAAQIGVWDWNLETKELEWDESMYRLYGIRRADFAGVYQAWRACVHPDDTARIDADLQAALRGEREYAPEFRIIRPDGAVRFIVAASRLFRAADGTPLRMIGTNIDITERKLADEALHRSEAFFRRSFDETPVCAAFLTTDGHFQRVNAALCRFLGYTAEELAALTIGAVTHPDDVAESLAAVRRLLNGEITSFEIDKRYRRKDGRSVWGRVSVSLLRDAAGQPLFLSPIIQDIDERKRAEAALRESEQRYAATLAAVNDGLWEWHVPSGDAYFSPSYFAVLGYGDGAFTANYANWRQRVHPADLDRVETDLRQSIATGVGFTIDLRMKTSPGEWRWVCTRGNTVERDTAGQVLRMAGTLSDISERKRAEQDLQQFFDLVPDMVCIVSADGFFRTLNDQWVRVLGYTKAELMAVPATDFIHPDDRAATAHVAAGQRAGRSSTNFINRYRAKDGSYRWFEWNATAVNDAGLLFAAARDITEHRQAEEAIRESEVRFRTLADSGQALIWTAGLDKKCNYFNQTWLDFTGRPLAHELGDGWTEGVHPEDFDRCVATYVTAFDRHEKFSMDYRLRHRDGTYHWIQDNGSPRFDSQGIFLGYIGHCLDITERKQVEAELHQKTALLEAQLDSTLDGILVVDKQGKKLLQNRRLKELWQIPPDIADNPDDRAQVRHVMEKTREPEVFAAKVAHLYSHPQETSRDELELVNGTVFDRYSAPVVGRDGQYYGRIWTFRDITDRKRAEQALQESEEKFARIFHAAPAWIGITDMETAAYVDINDEALRLSGFSRDEVIGHTSADFGWITAAERTRLAQQVQANGRTSGIEMTFHDRAGRVHIGWLSSERIRIQGRPCLLTIIVDITERKNAEEERRRSHELLAKLAAQVPGVVYQYQLFPDGRACFPFSSPGMQAIYEYSPEDVREDATPVFGRLHPDDVAFVSAAIFESARTLAPFHCEFRVVLPQQGLRWRLCDAMPERTPDGGTLWHGIISDITPRRQVEESIQASLREKEALLKEVHHRVKNNLQIISSLLRLQAGQIEHPATIEVLQDMQGRIRSMALLHETLYRTGNLAQIDLADYLESICTQQLRSSARRDAGAITFAFDLSPVLIDATQAVPCGLLVNELAANCFKHAFPGGRSGTVRVRLHMLESPASADAPAVEIAVADNGVGLPPGFDIAQLHSLGLQLVSDLAHQLRGTLAIGPGPQAGTVFTVVFPLPRTPQ